MIESGSIVVKYGPFHSGKSFECLWSKVMVAAGRPVFGRQVKQGPTFYICAEGGLSLRRRLDAIELYCKEICEPLDINSIPFFAYPTGLNLLDADTQEQIIQGMLAHGAPPQWLGVDPLARVNPTGREDNETFNQIVIAASRIRDRTAAAVEIVHHTPDAAPTRTRGGTGLPAGADTLINIFREPGSEVVKMTLPKQREGRSGHGLVLGMYRLKQIVVGQTPSGRDVTSCVPVMVSEDDTAVGKHPKPGTAAARAYKQLWNCLADHGENYKLSTKIPSQIPSVPVKLWKDYIRRASVDSGTAQDKETEAQKRARNRGIERLQDDGIVEIFDGRAWPVYYRRDSGTWSGHAGT